MWCETCENERRLQDISSFQLSPSSSSSSKPLYIGSFLHIRLLNADTHSFRERPLPAGGTSRCRATVTDSSVSSPRTFSSKEKHWSFSNGIGLVLPRLRWNCVSGNNSWPANILASSLQSIRDQQNPDIPSSTFNGREVQAQLMNCDAPCRRYYYKRSLRNIEALSDQPSPGKTVQIGPLSSSKTTLLKDFTSTFVVLHLSLASRKGRQTAST
jgi:hypothetical protein